MLNIFFSLLIDLLDKGRLPFYKKITLKFRKFRLSNGTVLSGRTNPPKSPRASISSEPTKELAVSIRQKSETGNKNVVKFRSDRSGLPSKVVPNIPVRPTRNGPFHLTSNRNFRNIW